MLSCCSVVARLEGNPLCNDSLLSGTMLCTDRPTEPRTVYPSFDLKCADPFVETIVFRSPSFGDFNKYLAELHSDLLKTLNNCTQNQLRLESYNEVYQKVDIKVCPVNQKRFTYFQVLNCFNLTLQTYKPPENFGPYYVHALPYFHSKSN
jgi:hypothetical protein